MYGQALYRPLQGVQLQGKGISQNDKWAEGGRKPGSYDTFHRNRIAQDGKVRAERDRRGNKNSTEPYKLGLGSQQYS